MSSSNWNKLKSKIKQPSFDDEFEKFMNESLSDESGNTPRRSITPLSSRLKSTNTPKAKVDSEKPWWESEDEFESSVLADIVKRKWHQSKSIDNEAVEEKQHISRDSLESPGNRSGTALDTILSEAEYSSIHESQSEDESISIGNESSVELPTNKPIETSGSEKNKENDSEASNTEQAGIDTIEDIRHKEEFFSTLEKNGKVDFRQLNEEFNKASSIESSNESDEEGLEVLGLTPYRPAHFDDESEDDISSKVDDSKNIHNAANVGELERSLLSKVNLMESLDSTGGLMLAEKIKAKQYKEKVSEDVNKKDGKKMTNTKPIFGLNLKDNQIQEEMSQNIINDLKTIQPIQSGMLVLDKQDTHLVRLNDFDLQPVVTNFAQDSQPTVFLHTLEDSISINQEDFNEAELIKKVADFSSFSLHDSPTHNSSQHDSTARGFSLQPVNDTKDENSKASPPSESLRSIKSIAAEKKKKLLEKSISQIQNKMVPTAPKKRKPMLKDQEKIASSKKPIKMNSLAAAKVPINSPKQLKKKSPIKSNSVLSTVPYDVSKVEDSQVLLASVASFASYLKDFAQSSKMPLKTSFNETDKNGHLAALEREAALQKELQDIRILFEDERNRSEKIHRDLLHKEKEWRNEKDKLMFEHDQRLKYLHEEILVLKKKNLIDDTHLSSEKKLFNEISKEDLEKLRSQLEQQEILLNGYQQENQRMYLEAKKTSNEKKQFEAKLVKENQRLALELGNLKEQFDSRPNFDSHEGTATLGAQRINQLENQVKFYQKREQEYKQEILDLEKEVNSLKDKVEAKEKVNFCQEIDVRDHNQQNLIERLQKKVSWYAENQELLDRHNTELNSKKSEVEQLTILVKKLEEENKELRNQRQDNKAENTNNGKQISDLKRQVKEMEAVMKRRQPSSIPTMMYVASAVPGVSKAYNPQNEKSKLHLYLENRVKSLENELESKDADYSTKVRAIEQRYNAMSIHYEEYSKQLEGKISELTNQLKMYQNSDLKKILTENETVNSKLREEKTKNDDGTLSKDNVEKKRNENCCEDKTNEKDAQSCNSYIVKLKEKLRARDYIINELQETVALLQKERENMLQNNQNNKPIAVSKPLADPKDPSNSTKDLRSKCTKLKEKNKCLESKIEELLLLCEEKRLKYEAMEAEVFRDKRNMQENYEEQIQKILNEHMAEIKMQKMNFVVEHSKSKVAELNGKVESGELMIAHLKGIIEDLKEDQEKLKFSKQVEDSLRGEIRRLETELFDAQKLHTPEMRHYKELEAKIYNMEMRRLTREKEIRMLLEKTKLKANFDVEIVEEKWKSVLKHKDEELNKFREELDSIIEILKELQRQGVVLPNRKYKTAP